MVLLLLRVIGMGLWLTERAILNVAVQPLSPPRPYIQKI